MRITEVRVKLMDEPNERLLAFCSVTFENCFVVRDLKLIQGKNGIFVAMPSRKLMDRCPTCHSKNPLRAFFCGHCGKRLRENRAFKDDDGRSKLYADIAHPIHSECREHLQEEVIRAFEKERVLAADPNYVCLYDDLGEDHHDCDDQDWEPAPLNGTHHGTHRHIDPPETLRGQHRFAHVPDPAPNSRVDVHQDDFGDGLL